MSTNDTVEHPAMRALAESWDTYMCSSADPLCGHALRGNSLDPIASLFIHQDLVREAGGVGTAPDTFSLSAAEASGSGVWFLSLVCHNRELMKATAHLFLQFVSEFCCLSDEIEAHVQAVRERHAEQLTALLDVGPEAADMIVRSEVTQSIVMRHHCELDALLKDTVTQKRSAEASMRGSMLSVLQAAALDAVTALSMRQSRNRGAAVVTGLLTEPTATRTAATQSDATPLYVPVVNVSHFALSGDGREVPVRTVKMANPFRDQLQDVGPNDRAAQPIVMDLSPLCRLTDCLRSCSDVVNGGAAAEEHLMRLAHTKHSMMFLIGSEAEAYTMLHSLTAPELFLGQHRNDDKFSPLAFHPSLRVLFNTRLWGANVVLLWSPSATNTSLSHTAQTEDFAVAGVMEAALHLALSWNVDMFTVAVLDSMKSPSGTSIYSRRTASAISTDLDPSQSTPSHQRHLYASHMFSVEVLRRIQYGIACILLESPDPGVQQLWTVQDEELLSKRFWSGQSSSLLPRAVGASILRRQAVAQQQASQLPNVVKANWSRWLSLSGDHSKLVKDKVSAASSLRKPGSPSGSYSKSEEREASLSSNTVSVLAPTDTLRLHVHFNTPMAIRVFLPIPESYFLPSGEESGDRETAAAETPIPFSPIGTSSASASAHVPPPPRREGSLNIWASGRSLSVTTADSFCSDGRSTAQGSGSSELTLQGLLTSSFGDSVEVV